MLASKSLASLVAADPGKEPLDHPSARQNSKADLIRALGDDFDDDAGRGGDAFAGISAISKDPLDERKQAAGGLQERPTPVAILNAGRVRLDQEATPVRVNQRMTFAPVDLLAGITTARAASLRGLDALAVDDRGRRTGFAPDPLAIRYHQRMVDLLEQAGIAPGCKPAIDRAPGRKVLRNWRHGQPERIT